MYPSSDWSDCSFARASGLVKCAKPAADSIKGALMSTLRSLKITDVTPYKLVD